MTALTLPLATERLILRAHRESDVQRMREIHATEDVTRFLLDDPWTAQFAAEKVAERIPRTDLAGETGALALVIEHGGTAIGLVLIWLTDRERGVAEIGWVLDPQFSGQGFGVEAAGTVLNLAFDRYPLHRVVARMDGRNLASARLAAAIGMRQEAHLRQDWWSKGEWTDTVIFGVLASDLRERPARPSLHRRAG